MKTYSPAYYYIYRSFLKFALPLYFDFRYRFKKPPPRGPKIIVGNHPMVYDVFPFLVMFKDDMLHTLIEEQIWSLPLMKLLLSITNHIKSVRGVGSMRSLHDCLTWLKRGHSVALAPEGERTSVNETREATRGIVWLAIKAKVPLVPVGFWISEEDLFSKKVRYYHNGERYTVESFFPRYRSKYFLLVDKEIRLDQYYDKKLSSKKRQEIADEVLEKIYDLKEEAKNAFTNRR